MTTPDRDRNILLAALDTAQEREHTALQQAQAAAHRATTAALRAHRLEQQLDQAHQIIAEQTMLIETLGGRPAREAAA